MAQQIVTCVDGGRFTVKVEVSFDLCFYDDEPCGPELELLAIFGPQSSNPTEPPSMSEKTAVIGDGPFTVQFVPKHGTLTVPVDGPASVVLDNPGLFDVTPLDETGLAFRIVDKGIVGTTTGRVTVDARTGPEVVPKTVEFTLSAVLPEADTIDVVFGDQLPTQAVSGG